MSWLTKFYLGLVAFSLAGYLFSRLAHVDPGPIQPIASTATLLIGVVALLSSIDDLERGYRIAAVVCVLLFGAAVEMIGLRTGFPFGRYEYTSQWAVVFSGPDFRFPLLLPCAWMLVAGSSYLVASTKVTRSWAVLGGALLATAVDFVMEPVMVGALGYWRWLDHGPLPGGAPLLNPVGWFLTSLAAGGMLAWAGVESRKRDPFYVLLGHMALILGIGAIASI